MKSPNHKAPEPELKPGPLEVSPLFVWTILKWTGPWLSLDHTWEICERAQDLVEAITKFLPCIGLKRTNPEKVTLRTFWFVQLRFKEIVDIIIPYMVEQDKYGYYKNKAALDPNFPFGNENGKCPIRIRGSAKVRDAAMHFIWAIDAILHHYEWQKAERWTRLDEVINVSDPDSRKALYEKLAPEEVQVPSIDKRILHALRKAAGTLWRQVLKELPRKLGPRSCKMLAEAGLPFDTNERVQILLFMHPDWKNQQIADAAGINIGHLFRLKINIKETRKRIRHLGGAEVLDGVVKDTKNRRIGGAITDTHLEELQNDESEE